MNAGSGQPGAVAPPVRVRRVRQVDGCLPGCPQPSIVAQLSIADEPLPPGFAARLDELLGLASEGTSGQLPQLIAQACQRIHRKAGVPQFSAPVIEREGDLWQIQLPTLRGAHEPSTAVLRWVAEVASALWSGADAKEHLQKLAGAIEDLRAQAPAGKNPLMMLETAHRAGIPWRRVAGNVYSLGSGRYVRWFNSSITDRTSSIGVQLAKNKDLAAQVLRHRGIPVPDHEIAETERHAVAIAERLGYPVVVKPSNQDRGIGVFAMLRTPEKVAEAWRAARKHSRAILVEKYFEGEDYRVFVHEGEVFRVRHRVPGGVTGDGRSTIRELLAVVNADPRRGPPGSFSEWIRIDLDAEAMELLAEQGLSPDDAAPQGRFVRLRRIANVSVGGVPHVVDIADVHPDNLKLAIRAVAALKLDLAAIDLLMPDIRQSWTRVGAAICEVNAQPQWSTGAPEWLYAKLFPNEGRVPVVAVIADELPAWLNAVNRRVSAAGLRLGFCSGAGAWRGSERLSPASPQGAFHACGVLLEEPGVDAIVILADPSVVRIGMPVDRIDALVLSSNADLSGNARLVAFVSRFTRRVLADTDAAGWRGAMHAIDGTVTEVPASAIVDEVTAIVTGAGPREAGEGARPIA